jgi:hypothetical protein
MLPPLLWCAMRLAASKVNSALALPTLLAVVLLWPVTMQAISKVTSVHTRSMLVVVRPRCARL